MDDSVLHAIVDSSPIGKLLVDPQGRIRMVNSQIVKMFGYTSEELLGASVDILVPERLRPKHVQARLDYARNPTVRPMGADRELFGISKNGAEIPIEIGLSPISTASGNYFLATIVDISERVHSQAVQRASLERLRELEGQLAHANRTALMGEMAASLANDLNQPLTSLVTNLRACLRGLAFGTLSREEMVTAIDASAEQSLRASEIIQRFRRFLGRQTPAFADISIVELLLEVRSLCQPEANKWYVALKFENDCNSTRIWADRIQLQQLLVNLIQNGIEALREIEGNRTLQVSVTTGIDRVRIQVADNGPGMDDEVARQIFKPYFTTKVNGLGMGLAVCQSIVTAHHGQIQLEKYGPTGTTLWVELPIKGKG